MCGGFKLLLRLRWMNPQCCKIGQCFFLTCQESPICWVLHCHTTQFIPLLCRCFFLGRARSRTHGSRGVFQRCAGLLAVTGRRWSRDAWRTGEGKEEAECRHDPTGERHKKPSSGKTLGKLKKKGETIFSLSFQVAGAEFMTRFRFSQLESPIPAAPFPAVLYLMGSRARSHSHLPSRKVPLFFLSVWMEGFIAASCVLIPPGHHSDHSWFCGPRCAVHAMISWVLTTISPQTEVSRSGLSFHHVYG